ncbi:MAG: hypothetical protein GWP19_00825 [Planctomycetia bacterium]|nr:hypothetical protein [Planctomycetia bacterium]
MKKQITNEQQWKLLVLILKKISEEKGISHQKIADVTGLQRSNVTRMFGLKYSPNMKTFLMVAKAINVNFFFEDKDSKMDLNKTFEAAM